MVTVIKSINLSLNTPAAAVVCARHTVDAAAVCVHGLTDVPHPKAVVPAVRMPVIVRAFARLPLRRRPWHPLPLVAGRVRPSAPSAGVRAAAVVRIVVVDTAPLPAAGAAGHTEGGLPAAEAAIAAAGTRTVAAGGTAAAAMSWSSE